MSYPKQLELKQDMLRQCFHGLGLEVLPIMGTPKPLGYRNKIEFSFGKYLVKNSDYKESDIKDKKIPPNPPLSKGKEDLLGVQKKFTIAEHWQLGFHKQGEFSKVVDVDQCYLVSEPMHAVYMYIKDQLQQS
jgi:tRNA/tmRNA/rRNA uracil-C5-methylase (TrmA/RlmC/RlmD family)